MYAKVRKKNEKVFLELLGEKFLEEGQIVSVKIEDVRDIQTHKRYFEILEIFVDSAPDLLILNLLDISPKEYLELKNSKRVLKERVRKAIEIELGFVSDEKMTLIIDDEPIKVTRKVAKSIAYDKMSENDFKELHRSQKQLIFNLLEEYGWTPKELKEQYQDFYGTN